MALRRRKKIKLFLSRSNADSKIINFDSLSTHGKFVIMYNSWPMIVLVAIMVFSQFDYYSFDHDNEYFFGSIVVGYILYTRYLYLKWKKEAQ